MRKGAERIRIFWNAAHLCMIRMTCELYGDESMSSRKPINRNSPRAALLLLLLFAIPMGLRSQYFGKNKVQYEDFKWKFLQSKHFDVYYYENGLRLAEFTADVAESSYVALKQDFRGSLKKRIPIIVYNSHNDFEQTNVTQSILTEGVEGFTEVFKDRVVVQFKGSYSEFRHLIHHELTHAVTFQALYGGGVGSVVTGMARFQVPLWVMEGIAEYESTPGWDNDSDMFMRDATINGYIPPIPQLYGYFNYKGGQSVFVYLAEKYGEPKVGELLSKIRAHRNVEEGLKKSIGVGTEELTKQWHKYLRKTYWPDIEDRDEPEDAGKRLTDHVKEKHSLNNSPALSPKGDMLVYLSNRSDFIDVYLMSALDGRNMGRLAKGERSDLFEELHWLRPGMSWSPDGKKIILAAKAKAEDAMHVIDVKKKKIVDTFQFDMLDGVFSPSWSPDGDRIAFMGFSGGQTDIYVYHLSSQKLDKITNDIFSDLDPTWSPDGDEIAFVSDRGHHTSRVPQDYKIQRHDIQQMDLYTVNVQSGMITRHTNDEAKDSSPAYSPEGDKIAFISDRSGISNIYILDTSSAESYPITNLVSGVTQISWSREGSRLAFSSFFNGGWDLYMINNPLEVEPGSTTLRKTSFMEKQEKSQEPVLVEADPEDIVAPEETNFRNFVFGEAFRQGKIDAPEKNVKEFLETPDYKDSTGVYRTKKYKIRFTPDYISGGAGYSQFFGLQGSSMIVLSDILGNHQISLYTDLFYNLKNSNFQVGYMYLPKRIDMGAAIFHYSYLWYTYFSDGVYYYPGYYRDRYYGLTFFLSRPFDRYRRLDFQIVGQGIDRDYGEIDYWGYEQDFLEDMGSLYKRRLAMISLGYTTDTVLWGMTGPVNGGRSIYRLAYSPSISKKYGLDFWSLRGDWRRYFRIKRDYTLSLRLAGGLSEGKNPQRFLLGGMRGWINYKYKEISAEDWEDDVFYFSSIETPLRGPIYYELIGTRFLLANLEFRFPLIRFLILGWPLPLGFQNIRGVVFMDVGSAWYGDEKWKPLDKDSIGLIRLNKDQAVAGFGFGARLNMGFLLLKYDLAWKTDFAVTAKSPVHYFTLGAEF